MPGSETEQRSGAARLVGWVLLGYVLAGWGAGAWAFDHGAWDALLGRHVAWVSDGTASRVDYTGFQSDVEDLDAYLAALSDVPLQEFATWDGAQRLAFLVNAYNAFTVRLVLTRYPDLDSIKDLGSLFSSPWKQRFFTLLGEQRHLDDIEHGLIRPPGAYDEPRIHFALVCAAIGCPALRDEAFVADRLDQQMEDSLVRFLSDRSRNRYNPDTGTLAVSKLFDWYEEDFSRGDHGFKSVRDLLARYAHLLADRGPDRDRIRRGQAEIRYLAYDWRLNALSTR